MSSEKRVIRPYSGLGVFQSILDKWCLKIGQELLAPGEQRTITASSYLHDPARLVCAADDTAAEQALASAIQAAEAIGLSPADVEVLVITRTPYLRLADVVHREPLTSAAAIPRQLTLAPSEARALRTPAGGCDVDVYFCLAGDQPPKPLRPTRRGTWLGHVRFSLQTELGEVGFTPLPLDAKERERLGLPADALRYVVVDGEVLEGEDLSAVELYVDEHVLAVLNQQPNTAGARFFQRQLFLDVVSAVVRAAMTDLDLEEKHLTDLEGTVLGRVVWAAAGKARQGESPADATNRREAALHSLRYDTEKFMALVENSVRPRDDLKLAIGGQED